MTDFDPTTVDWGRIFAEALEIALGTGSREAEDVVQQGMTLVLDGSAPFDASGKLTLAAHVVAAGLAARRNKERVERLRRRPKVVAKLTHWLDVGPPTPEELSDERQRGDAAFEAVLAACAGDAEVRELVLLSRQDVDEPSDQAERLGWGIERVRNARKRMSRMLAAVADGMRGERGEDP
jgi:hypothetical protein